MKCEIIRDLLPLYIDDALSDVSKEEVVKHLNGCRDCKRIYEEMNEINEQFCKFLNKKQLNKT